MAKSCPECKSGNTYVLIGGKIVCRNCGYDERNIKPSGLCDHTGLERLPSGNGLTLSSCCHENSDMHTICEIENQKKCRDYECEVSS